MSLGMVNSAFLEELWHSVSLPAVHHLLPIHYGQLVMEEQIRPTISQSLLSIKLKNFVHVVGLESPSLPYYCYFSALAAFRIYQLPHYLALFPPTIFTSSKGWSSSPTGAKPILDKLLPE